MQLTVNQVGVLQLGIPELLDLMSPAEAEIALQKAAHWINIRDKIAANAILGAIANEEVVSKEKHNETVSGMQAEIDDLTINEGAFEKDAQRLQEMIAEGRTADALALLDEMAPGAGLSPRAAMMVAGFRQPSLFEGAAK